MKKIILFFDEDGEVVRGSDDFTWSVICNSSGDGISVRVHNLETSETKTCNYNEDMELRKLKNFVPDKARNKIFNRVFSESLKGIEGKFAQRREERVIRRELRPFFHEIKGQKRRNKN